MSGRKTAILELIMGQWRPYAVATAALIVASLFLYAAPLVVQLTIDGVIVAEDPSPFVSRAVEASGGRAFLARNLWLPAAAFLAVTALGGLFTYGRARWSAQASETIARRMRERVYDHLQHLPCRYFDEAETGDLLQRCTSDVETLRVFLATQVVEIGRAVVMLAVPIPIMLAIDARMTVASFVLIPPMMVFALLFFRRIRRAFTASDEAEARLTTAVQENLTGIRVVRAFARQDYECERFGDRNVDHRDRDCNVYRQLAWYWSVSELLCFLQKGLVLGLGIYLLATGKLQIGAFYYFLTAAAMFIWPVRMVGRILADLGKATVAMGRLNAILAEPREADPAVPADPVPARGAVVFDRVSFAHEESAPVLRDISFSVEPGQTIALLGPSGCGKTTIVSLLLRLYDHDAGSIRLDGQELGALPRKQVRAQMAVVMQEPFLYSRSLRENITMGRPSAEEDEMIESASLACVHEAILDFDSGYETMVGERGVTLSGGQRQRVALARALLQEPAVLILDDALSAVDAETEELILDALRRRHGRQTTILIAHRLSTLAHADRILVLEAGRIVQQGSHEQLINEDGLYRRLWSIQHEPVGEAAGAGTTIPRAFSTRVTTP